MHYSSVIGAEEFSYIFKERNTYFFDKRFFRKSCLENKSLNSHVCFFLVDAVVASIIPLFKH